MPEGDTIHKIAAAMAPGLEGRRVEGYARRGELADFRDLSVTEVTARGKYLFIAFDSGFTVATHLGLYGDWHRYANGEAWRKPSWQASLVLSTEEEVFVCFNAREVCGMKVADFRLQDFCQRLGPDLSVKGNCIDDAAKRARSFLGGDTPLADVLLDQRVASGAGNVYKSEVLFLHGILPQTPLDAVDDGVLAALFAEAAHLLQKNLGPGPRRTRFVADGRGPLWVYGRDGDVCLVCDHVVKRCRTGENRRVTYWCPACQH